MSHLWKFWRLFLIRFSWHKNWKTSFETAVLKVIMSKPTHYYIVLIFVNDILSLFFYHE